MNCYVFVAGVVVSSLEKGIASASLAAILEARGLKVMMFKLVEVGTTVVGIESQPFLETIRQLKVEPG